MKTLTLTLAVAAAALVLNSNVVAGPGGREPNPQLAPRQYPVMTTAPRSSGAGATIGLAVTAQPELKLVQRFNAQGQAFYIYVPTRTETAK